MATEYLTIDQIVEKLHVHRNTVENWLRSGKLRGSQPGGRIWRISSDALDKFLVSGERRTEDNVKENDNAGS